MGLLSHACMYGALIAFLHACKDGHILSGILHLSSIKSASGLLCGFFSGADFVVTFSVTTRPIVESWGVASRHPHHGNEAS